VASAYRVSLYGVDATKRVLREHAPELKREMDATIRDRVVTPVVSRAKAEVPKEPPLPRWHVFRPGLRGGDWPARRMEWDTSTVRKGVKGRQGGGRVRGRVERAAWRISNVEAPGVIFETAGRGTSSHPFVENLRGRHGRSSRVVWRAWDQLGADTWAPKTIIDTIREFEDRFQQQISAAGRERDF
jgi:hypothetical protein